MRYGKIEVLIREYFLAKKMVIWVCQVVCVFDFSGFKILSRIFLKIISINYFFHNSIRSAYMMESCPIIIPQLSMDMVHFFVMSF